MTFRTDDRRDEKGVAMVWVATLMVVLLGVSAFAVDLGWAFLSQSRLQRAADAGALAGVVHLPSSVADATTDASNAAGANGYPIGGDTTISIAQLADNRLEVELATRIPTFFLGVLGFDTFDLRRKSTAEYIKPVPMGSPYNSFGVGSDPSQRFWAAISGPRTNKKNGDAYATEEYCDSGWHNDCNVNAQYRPAGYYYAIEVPAGVSDVTIDVYDAGFYDRGSFSTETGDREQDENGGVDTHFQVYDVDVTPLDPTDNTAIGGCGWSIAAEASSSTYKNRWQTLCSLSGSVTPGIYVLRVWSTGDHGGTNQYAVRASSASGPNPSVYGINDISIFTNQSSAVATLSLAEVVEAHAGKKLELSFYDPGEDSDNAWMTVKMPDGSTPNCSWIAQDESGSTVDSGSGTCSIQTSNSSGPMRNGQWIIAVVDIPDTYMCGSSCWWTMQIQLNNPHDRTVWKARIIGNPVRLVPNA